MDCEPGVEYPGGGFSGFAGAEQILLRFGWVRRFLWRRRQRVDGIRRAGAFDRSSRYPEFLSSAGRGTDDRKVVHRRGVPGEIQQSAGRHLELRLLAAAGWVGP